MGPDKKFKILENLGFGGIILGFNESFETPKCQTPDFRALKNKIFSEKIILILFRELKHRK